LGVSSRNCGAARGKPRSGDSDLCITDLLSPLRGLWPIEHQNPWAYAQGYLLPSLRDYKTAQPQNVRIVLPTV
jgi:hypothetical protein